MQNKMFSRKLRAIVSLALVFVLCFGTFPAYADLLSDLQAQHDANSAAWWIAKAAGDQATMDQLAAENAALREQMKSAADVSYDEETGVTTVNGNSNADVGFNESYNSGYGAFSDEAIDAYINAGGTNQGVVDGYNTVAKNEVDNYVDGSGPNLSAEAEMAVIKQVENLSDTEAESLQEAIEEQKNAYQKAYHDYYIAKNLNPPDEDAMEAAKEAMDKAHDAAEALRDPYGYSGDGDRSQDENGGFITWEPGENADPEFDPSIFDVSDVIDQIQQSYDNAHIITLTVGTGGTVSPAGDSYRCVYVPYGRTQTFTITPSTGYTVASVKFDGVELGAIGSYTFDYSKISGSGTSTSTTTGETTSSTSTKTYSFDSDEAAEAWIEAYKNGDTDEMQRIIEASSTTSSNTDDFYSAIWNEAYKNGDTATMDKVTASSDAISGGYYVSESSTLQEMKDAWFAAQAAGDTVAMDNINAMIEERENSGSSTNTNDGNSSTVNVTTTTNTTTSTTETKTYHTLVVTFKQGQSYTITASSGAGGSISPSGSVSVAQGSNQTFTITPDTGYGIKSVIVDGVDQGAKTSYTFSNVTKAHTIKAEFKSLGKIDIGDLELKDSNGADLDGSSIKSGYGFFIRNLSLDAQYVKNLKVTFTYNFGQGNKSVTLEQVGGKWEFPVNADSPLSRRCIYIPVETKDNTYTVTVEAVGIGADGSTLKDTATARITVKGSMYEDDFTGDS